MMTLSWPQTIVGEFMKEVLWRKAYKLYNVGGGWNLLLMVLMVVLIWGRFVNEFHKNSVLIRN